MRAVWIQDGKLELRNIASPQPTEGECLLDVRLAGICGTDLELLRGYYNFAGVPGHEFIATVASGGHLPPGTRVVGNINVSCGTCQTCLKGQRSHCPDRRVLGIKNLPGAFAEQVCLPAGNLVVVPDNVTDQQAVLAEPLAAALEILEQIDIDALDQILVVGAGRLGRLVCEVLGSTCPARVTVYSRSSLRAPSLPQGVTFVSAPPQCGRYDLVVECTGHPDGFQLALDSVVPKGTIVIKSTYASHLEIDMSRVVVNELTLLGSRCGPMARAVAWLAEGKASQAPLELLEFPLDRFEEAFRRSTDPAVGKVYLRPGLS